MKELCKKEMKVDYHRFIKNTVSKIISYPKQFRNYINSSNYSPVPYKKHNMSECFRMDTL